MKLCVSGKLGVAGIVMGVTGICYAWYVHSKLNAMIRKEKIDE